MRRLSGLQRRLWIIVLCVFAGGLSAAYAQTAADYAIRDIRAGLSEDGANIVVDFVVVNDGQETELPETARLYDDSGVEIASRSIPRLATNERFDVRFEVPTARFPSGGQERLIVTVGLETLPPPDQQQRKDIARISVFIPDVVVQGTPTAPDTGAPAGETTDGSPLDAITGALEDLGITLDLNDPLQIALIGVIIVIALILLYVLVLIVRLIFTRPPTFPAWQPPYLYSTLIDPNSTPGRRQMWQQHAQNDLLPPCMGGGHAARKALFGANGGKLQGWRVTGMRAVQYDMYGRVNRTASVAPKSAVSRVDRAARRSAKLTPRRAERLIKPGARALVDALIKQARKRALSLPVAVDVRLSGQHGDVRIAFELYECTAQGWRMIDTWQPELNVMSGTITENFTYNLYGQRPNEPRKVFRARATDELTALLVAMITPPPTPKPSPETLEIQHEAPVTQEVRSVEDEVDDSTI